MVKIINLKVLRIVSYNLLFIVIGLIFIQLIYFYFIEKKKESVFNFYLKENTHSNLIGHHEYLHHQAQIYGEHFSEKYAKDIRFTNSKGWWGKREYELQKKNKRIFILGDSQAEGYMRSRDDDPFIYLEKKLKSKYNKDVEIINTAYSSYSTLIHYVNLTKYIYPYQPDHVLIYFDLGSDFGNDSMYNFLAIRDKNNKIIKIPGLNENRKYYLIGNKIFLQNEIGSIKKLYSKTFVSFIISKISNKDNKNIFFKNKNLIEIKDFDVDVNITLSAIEDILEFTNSNNIKLSFILIPAIESLETKNYKHYKNLLVEYLVDKNINYVDAIDLYNKNEKEKYLTFDNYHISPYYHKKIISKIITDILNDI